MSNLNQFFGGSIKSVQRGDTTATDGSVTNVTISAVNTAKSFVTAGCKSGRRQYAAARSENNISLTVHPKLTSSTNLQLPSMIGGDEGQMPVVSWEVVEFY